MPSCSRFTLVACLAAGLCFGAIPHQSFGAPPPLPKYTYKSLGTLGGATSTADGMNDAGDVVGISKLADGTSAPFVYTAAQGMRNLNVITDGPLDSPGQPRFGPDRTGDGVADLYIVCAGYYHAQGASVVVCDGVTGQYRETFIPQGTGGMAATAYMLIGPDGDFYISSSPSGSTNTNGRNRVLKFDGTSGAYLGDFVAAGSGGLLGATGMAFGTDLNGDTVGDFFVASNVTNNVLAYDGIDGTFLGVFIAAGSGGLNDGVGDVHFVRDFDNDNVPDLLVVSRSSNVKTAAVLLFSGLDGHFIRTFSGPMNGYAFNSMTIGTDGDLYLPSADPMNTLLPGADLVFRFDGTTGTLKGTIVASGSGGLNGPGCFTTFDAQGDLYVNSNNTNQILKYQGPYGTSPGAFVKIFTAGVGFTFTSARDINALGQIVGGGHPLGHRNLIGEVAAYRYTPPTPGQDVGNAIDLQLPGSSYEEAVGINDSGDVAGYFLSPADNHYHAFYWTDATGAVDLGTLAGSDTYVTAITNRSAGNFQISGYAVTSGGYRAWRYNTVTHTMQNLGLISGSSGFSQGWDINNSGVEIGSASAGSNQHAFSRTLSGSMVDLGTLGGSISLAVGINSAGTIVGTSDTTTKSSTNQNQAFGWIAGNGMFKLEPQITNLPTSMKLKIRPNRINTGGQICGPSEFDTAGVAFVLTPQ